MHLFIYFFVTNFVRKIGTRPGFAVEPLTLFIVKKWTFCLIRLFVIDDFKRGVLRETTPSSMAASRFKYNTLQLVGEFSLVQWLWYWLFNQVALVQILSEPYISAMHLFIYFFVTNFVRKK